GTVGTPVLSSWPVPCSSRPRAIRTLHDACVGIGAGGVFAPAPRRRTPTGGRAGNHPGAGGRERPRGKLHRRAELSRAPPRLLPASVDRRVGATAPLCAVAAQGDRRQRRPRGAVPRPAATDRRGRGTPAHAGALARD